MPTLPRRIGAEGWAVFCSATLLKEIKGPILVGTWAAATWAIRFYEKHGFRQVTPAEKDRLLRTYWSISERHVETSVVLANSLWFRQ